MEDNRNSFVIDYYFHSQKWQEEKPICVYTHVYSSIRAAQCLYCTCAIYLHILILKNNNNNNWKIPIQWLTLIRAAPAMAPIHWLIMKKMPFRMLQPPVTIKLNVTAGLIWHPLTWPIAWNEIKTKIWIWIRLFSTSGILNTFSHMDFIIFCNRQVHIICQYSA